MSRHADADFSVLTPGLGLSDPAQYVVWRNRP